MHLEGCGAASVIPKEGCCCLEAPILAGETQRGQGQPGDAHLPPAEGMLESFDNHPPIILPSGGFKVDLEVETLDDNIYRHLLYIRHFLWSLQSKSPHGGEGPGSVPPKVASVPAPHGGAVFGVVVVVGGC